MPFSFESPIFAGQAAQVTCLVSEGDLPLDISWSFEGKETMPQLGISITKVGRKASMLLIETAGYEHRGNFTCVAKNPAGSVNFTADLNVHGKELVTFMTRLTDGRNLDYLIMVFILHVSLKVHFIRDK